MSATILLEAAKVLRELVKAGPAHNDVPWRAVREPARSGDGTITSVITLADESVFEDAYCSLADATYIATMHPGVGLALAAWLDDHAHDHDAYDCGWVQCESLAVARAILGGAS